MGKAKVQEKSPEVSKMVYVTYAPPFCEIKSDILDIIGDIRQKKRWD